MKAAHRLAVCTLVALTLLFLNPFASAQETRPPAQSAAAGAEQHKDSEKEATPIPPEKAVTTRHEMTLGGKTLKYTATAGTLLIRDDEDKPNGSIFYVAYTLDGAERQGAAAEFSLQRRSRLGFPVVAHGVVFAGAHRDRQPQPHRRAALQAGAQRVLAARQERPGLHRRASDRLLARRGQGNRQGLQRRRPGSARIRSLHPPLPHRQPALEFAQVPDRRVLRHHALRCPGRYAGQRRRATERRGV